MIAVGWGGNRRGRVGVVKEWGYEWGVEEEGLGNLWHKKGTYSSILIVYIMSSTEVMNYTKNNNYILEREINEK